MNEKSYFNKLINNKDKQEEIFLELLEKIKKEKEIKNLICIDYIKEKKICFENLFSLYYYLEKNYQFINYINDNLDGNYKIKIKQEKISKLKLLFNKCSLLYDLEDSCIIFILRNLIGKKNVEIDENKEISECLKKKDLWISDFCYKCIDFNDLKNIKLKVGNIYELYSLLKDFNEREYKKFLKKIKNN